MQRPPENHPRRWGHRSDRNRTTGLVASVVAAAHLGRADDVPNLATYHAPPAAHLRQGERDDRALRFDDVTPEAPAAPVRPVRRELRPDAGRAVLAFLSAAEQHFSPEALTHGVELRSVPLVEPPVEEPADPWATLVALLAEPDPVTDWAEIVVGIQNRALRILSGAVADTTRLLNWDWNEVQCVRVATAEILADVDAVERDLIDAVADAILAEVAL